MRTYTLAAAVLVLALAILVSAGTTHGDALRVSGDVVRVVVEFRDGSTQVLEAQQPTVTPSATPPPTNTPRPTDAPTPVDTEPSPTPDVIPYTPGPTAVPTSTCAVKLGADRIRLRSEPTTGATILGVLDAGTIQTIYEWSLTGGYLWARNERGWFATYQTSWWVYGVEGQTARCVDVPGWPDTWTPPAAIVRASTAWGVWNGPGSNTAEVLAFINELKAAGITPAVTVYGNNALANAAYDAGATVLARPWLSDCPDMGLPSFLSAQQRVDQALASLAHVRYHWLVLTNECVWPSVEYAAAWIRTAIDYAEQRGVTHLVPVVWAPGHPELDTVAVLAAVYDTREEISLGWGMNLYPVEPGIDMSARGGISEYTVWRWRLYRHQLPDDVKLIVTEAARGDGSERAVMDDIRLFVARAEGELDIVTFWYNAGPSGLGHWPLAVLWGRLNELADAIVAGIRN